jgi:uncharacterized membrane protein
VGAGGLALSQPPPARADALEHPGKVDGWGDKSWATFLMPGMMIAFLILFAFLPALSPKHFEVDSFRSTYLYIMVLITGLFAYMNGVIPLERRGAL